MYLKKVLEFNIFRKPIRIWTKKTEGIFCCFPGAILLLNNWI